MARRPPPPDPELVALARDRLARVLGAGAGDRLPGARRVVRAPDPDEPVGGAADRDHEVLTGGPGRGRPGEVGLDDLEPPRRFTRWHLGVVAAVLLVGLVWGGWAWARARPEAVAAPSVVETGGGPAGAAPAGSADLAGSGAAGSGADSPAPAPAGAPTPGGPVVHVLGAVRHPGLVRLAVGARVQDAITAAGGLRRDADPAELNLAAPLTDGVQVVVGTRRRPAGEVRTGDGSGGAASSGDGSSGSSASGSGSGSSGATVDLNRATLAQLDSLPGVGPVTAQKILDWRQQHGRFSRAEELQEVDGIGPKTFARIAPHVRV